MDLKHYFEIRRCWLLMKMELYKSRKGLVMSLLIILGFLFIVGLLLAPLMDPALVVYEHLSGYAYTLLTGGCILSSLAYRDLGSSLRRYNYLMLPVSTLEKFLSMWLLTSVGWILLYTLIYTIYTLFANAIGQLLSRSSLWEVIPSASWPTISFCRVYSWPGLHTSGDLPSRKPS